MKQKNKQALDFTEGNIGGPMVRFALPVLLAMFLQVTYGAVDVLVVGLFGTPADVSAVSTGSQILQTLTLLIVGLSVGTTVLLGRKLGEKRFRAAGKVVGASIFLFAVLGLVMTAGVCWGAEALSSLMHAPAEAFDLTARYVRICGAGSAFIIAYNVLGGVFRGMGNSKVPMYTAAVACAFNVVGDFVFVAWLHMGVTGVALATVLAQVFSVVLSWFFIRSAGVSFELRRSYICFNFRMIKEIILVGAPVALQDLLVSISFLVVLAIVNGMGVIASAGVGVAEKLCGFIMLVPSAYMQYMAVFTAQNMGARKPQRARRALKYCMWSSLAVGIPMGAICFFYGYIPAGWFAADAAVVDAAAQYLRAYALDCVIVSFLFCFIGYFNGREKTAFVLFQGLAGAFLVRIPVSYVMSITPGATLFDIGLASPCATVVQLVLCVLFLARLRKRRKAGLELATAS